MTKEFTVYSKWLAYELRQQGFRLIKTDINKNFPQFICWVFENSEDLQIAIRCLTEKRKSK